MASKDVSIYDIELTQDSTDEIDKDKSNKKNKAIISNTCHMANTNNNTAIVDTPTTGTTVAESYTGPLTNNRGKPGDKFKTTTFRTVLQNELYKTTIKSMITKFKNNLHKKDTLPRNLNYQINKYCLSDNYFNDLKGGSPKDNLTEYINLEELEQLRNEFNSKIIKILEDNRATYLEEANIDGFYTENIIPEAVEEGFDKLTRTDMGTPTYLSEFKPLICRETIDWFNTTLKVEYGQIEADFALKKVLKSTSNKNITPNYTNYDNKDNNNKRSFQKFNQEHNVYSDNSNKVTPYNENKSISPKLHHLNNKHDSYYDHFDRHVQPRSTGTNNIYLNYHEHTSCHNTKYSHKQTTTTQTTTVSLTTPIKHSILRDLKQLPDENPTIIKYTNTKTYRILRKRKYRSKRNEITSFYKYKAKLKKLPSFFHKITNKGINNFSHKRLTVEEEGILSLGLKFIIRPPPNTLNELMQSYNNFVRLIRIKNQMLGCNGYSLNNSLSSYIPNKAFVPTKGGQALENYITAVYSTLLNNYNNLPPAYKVKHKIPKIFNITIDKLKKDSTIQICSADKNLGICIVDREWYEKEALRHLLDATTYTKIELVPSTTYFITSIKNIFMKNNKHHDKLLNYFLQTTKSQNTTNILQMEHLKLKIARFYLTIKIHKQPISSRPIVASIGSFTYYISSYLDKVLQQVMKQQISYLRNTNDLIIDVETNPLFKNIQEANILYTADIKDMYPSINIADGLCQLKVAIQEYNTRVDSTKHIHTEFIVDLARFVLTNNYFIFGHNTYWLQISGTAMGTPLAVTFACIYIGQLEKQLFNAPQNNNNLPLYYKRYIDDIFAVFKCQHDMDYFHSKFNALRHDNIKLITTHTGKCVTFMDLNISINNNNVEIKIYQKPQNSYLYLPPSSFHQKHVFHNTIMAELNRYKLKCTNAYDYETIQSEFYHRLIARGYSTNNVNKIFNHCASITRENLIRDLISKRNKTKQYNINTPMIFVTANTPLTKHLQFSKILQPTEELQSNPLCQLLFTRHKGFHRPITAYKRTKNLRECLTKSAYTYELQTLSTNNSTDEKL